MKILGHRALRGTNYYSRFQAIDMRLDIGALEERPSNNVPGLAEKLEGLIHTIHAHRCSGGEPGGFSSVCATTPMPGTWSSMSPSSFFSVGYGKTVDSYDPGIYNVIYRYRDKACGIAAGREAGVQLARMNATLCLRDRSAAGQKARRRT